MAGEVGGFQSSPAQEDTHMSSDSAPGGCSISSVAVEIPGCQNGFPQRHCSSKLPLGSRGRRQLHFRGRWGFLEAGHCAAQALPSRMVSEQFVCVAFPRACGGHGTSALPILLHPAVVPGLNEQSFLFDLFFPFVFDRNH